MITKFTTKDKIIKARIKIQKESPFFAYMSLYLKFKEDNKLPHPCGVDVNGNLYYQKDFIDKISDDELRGVIVHEILHLCYLHLTRRGTRDPTIWNVACDIVVNQTLQDNGYHLLNKEQYLVPSYGEIEVAGIKIEDIKEKTAEIVYDELIKKGLKKKLKKCNCGKDGGKCVVCGGRLDGHIEDKDKSPAKRKENEDRWTGKIEEAYVSAKMRGDVPAGIEKLLGKLHENKINWKTLLQRQIINNIPFDYTYAKPNKKSVSAGYYMPDYIKERIKVLVVIDTSGSIGKDELTDFLSEMVGMARAFQNRIEMVVLTHDTEVKDEQKVENGNIDNIMKLKIRGGGGTEHESTFEYIMEKIPDTKLAVFFTDGYSDLDSFDIDDYPFNKIFVISNGSPDQIDKNKAKVIEIEKWD